MVVHKMCAGWDLKPHSAFIWKRILGKPYCKMCTYRLEGVKFAPKKSIKRITDKQIEKNALKRERTRILHELFDKMWKRLPKFKYCTICDKIIYGENSSIYWDHLIPKSKRPDLELEEWNILFVCSECHSNRHLKKIPDKYLRFIKEAENYAKKLDI